MDIMKVRKNSLFYKLYKFGCEYEMEKREFNGWKFINTILKVVAMYFFTTIFLFVFGIIFYYNPKGAVNVLLAFFACVLFILTFLFICSGILALYYWIIDMCEERKCVFSQQVQLTD